MTRLTAPVATAIAWSAASAAAWFLWAWTTAGMVPVAVLTAALALDGFRRQARLDPLTGRARPLDLHTVASVTCAVVAAAIFSGYTPDWLVMGGLVAVAVSKGGACLRR